MQRYYIDYNSENLNENGNPLPQYNQDLVYKTSNATDTDIWSKLFDLTFQFDPNSFLEPERRLNRLLMSALVYDGISDRDQTVGVLNLMVWIDWQKNLQMQINLKNFGGAIDPNMLMEFRLYANRTDNKTDNPVWHVQLWGAASEFFRTIRIKPLVFDYVRDIQNRYVKGLNSATNTYGKLQYVFGSVGYNNPVTEALMEKLMGEYSLMLTTRNVTLQQFISNATSISLSNTAKMVNLGSSNAGRMELSTIVPEEGGNVMGRIITVINWNDVILHHGGNLDSAPHNSMILKNNIDHQMATNEAVRLQYITDKWIQI